MENIGNVGKDVQVGLKIKPFFGCCSQENVLEGKSMERKKRTFSDYKSKPIENAVTNFHL